MKRILCMLTAALLIFGGAIAEEEAAPRALVAYFSATGTTERLALEMAEIIGADAYEIVPEQPYTEADLDYYSGGRADREQDDPDARPAIAGELPDVSAYEIVFLGYPIWHGQAPRILLSFLEAQETSGLTFAPFCTSGGSGVGSSAENLRAHCAEDCVWLDGVRFEADAPNEELAAWLENCLAAL